MRFVMLKEIAARTYRAIIHISWRKRLVFGIAPRARTGISRLQAGTHLEFWNLRSTMSNLADNDDQDLASQNVPTSPSNSE